MTELRAQNPQARCLRKRSRGSSWPWQNSCPGTRTTVRTQCYWCMEIRSGREINQRPKEHTHTRLKPQSVEATAFQTTLHAAPRKGRCPFINGVGRRVINTKEDEPGSVPTLCDLPETDQCH